MRQPVAEITANVRATVRRDGIDLTGSGDLAERYVREAVRAYAERSLGGTQPMLADERQAERDVLAAVSGYGPLQPYLDAPEVEANRTSQLCSAAQPWVAPVQLSLDDSAALRKDDFAGTESHPGAGVIWGYACLAERGSEVVAVEIEGTFIARIEAARERRRGEMRAMRDRVDIVRQSNTPAAHRHRGCAELVSCNCDQYLATGERS